MPPELTLCTEHLRIINTLLVLFECHVEMVQSKIGSSVIILVPYTLTERPRRVHALIIWRRALCALGFISRLGAAIPEVEPVQLC
jgi:hypothetical protein